VILENLCSFLLSPFQNSLVSWFRGRRDAATLPELQPATVGKSESRRILRAVGEVKVRRRGARLGRIVLQLALRQIGRALLT
jgi:hypothetical protein